MEVSVVQADNVPEGCMLSLIAGQSRRLGPLIPRQKFAFSTNAANAAAAAGGSGMKVEVLSIRGTSRVFSADLLPGLTSDDGEAQFLDIPIKTASGSDGEGDPAKQISLRVEIKPYRRGDKKEGGKFDLSAVAEATGEANEPVGDEASRLMTQMAGLSLDPAQFTAENELNMSPVKTSGGYPQPRQPASHRHTQTLEARSYLEEHSILPFVEGVLRRLVKDKPHDPWGCISDLLPPATQGVNKMGETTGTFGKSTGPSAMGTMTQEGFRPPSRSGGSWYFRRDPVMETIGRSTFQRSTASMKIQKPEMSLYAQVEFKFEHLDYEAITGNIDLSRAFMMHVQDAIAQRAGVHSVKVEVELGAGSVFVVAAVRGASLKEANHLKVLLDADPQGLMWSVEKAVLQIPGVDSAQKAEQGLGAKWIQACVRQKLMTPDESRSRMGTASTVAPSSGQGTLMATGPQHTIGEGD